MADKWKATKEQVAIGVITAIILGISTFVIGSYTSLLNKVEANETSIQAITLALPPPPKSQKEINIELDLLLKSVQEDVGDLVINDGRDKVQQGMLLTSIQFDIMKLKIKMGLE